MIPGLQEEAFMQVLTQKDIIAICRDRGVPYSYMHIWRKGVEQGFVKGEPGSRCIDKEGLIRWLDSLEDIPEDCMYICDAVREHGFAYNLFMSWFRHHGVEVRKGGYRRNGRKYVRKSAVEQFVKEHHKGDAGKEES